MLYDVLGIPFVYTPNVYWKMGSFQNVTPVLHLVSNWSFWCLKCIEVYKQTLTTLANCNFPLYPWCRITSIFRKVHFTDFLNVKSHIQKWRKSNYTIQNVLSYYSRLWKHLAIIGVLPKWNRNSANSGNLVNHWSMNSSQFEDPFSHMCLAVL